MQPLTVDDVRPPASYEPVRAEARRRVIELKRDRRVRLGDLVSLVFENRDTVRAVVEELLRAERIAEPERIAQELEVFNALIPAEGELSATLFVEVSDPAELAVTLDQLHGVEGTINLEIAGERVMPRHDAGRSREDRARSVHYLRFELSAAQRVEMLEGGSAVDVVSDHQRLATRVRLTEPQRLALRADLLAR